jgi:5-deoxy-glucuronate isomerase
MGCRSETVTETLHFRKALKGAGYHELVSPGRAPLEHITLGLQRLREGEVQRFGAPAQESVLIVLGGKLNVSGASPGATARLERRSVFEDAAAAVYIAPGDEITVSADSDTEIAMARAPSSRREGLRSQVVLPANLQRREVGQDNWRRLVWDVIPGDFAADRLIVGETFNPPGNWSSSPPHKHDRHDPPRESRFEEVYFYRFDPPQGFGMQRVYTADGDLDLCYAVQQNDVVVLPRGYHPVVAAPGYRLYYLWVLAGQSRDPVWFEDPAHSWIRDGG